MNDVNLLTPQFEKFSLRSDHARSLWDNLLFVVPHWAGRQSAFRNTGWAPHSTYVAR